MRSRRLFVGKRFTVWYLPSGVLDTRLRRCGAPAPSSCRPQQRSPPGPCHDVFTSRRRRILGPSGRASPVRPAAIINKHEEGSRDDHASPFPQRRPAPPACPYVPRTARRLHASACGAVVTSAGPILLEDLAGQRTHDSSIIRGSENNEQLACRQRASALS
jgi:hypothetical protein